MSVAITGTYKGNLNVELTHGPSGAVIKTAAPVDNNGDGSSFSPTDLVASAAAACMMTIMAIVAERDGIDLSGMRMSLEKHMSADPRRIASVPTLIHMPASVPEDKRAKLEKAALSCPVHKSLHPEVETPVQFVYDT